MTPVLPQPLIFIRFFESLPFRFYSYVLGSLFKISINDGADKDIPWQDGKEEETEVLSNICVFDSKCARVIVDENNETTYVPYGATVFPALVDLMKKTRGKIEREMPIPQEPEYLGIPATTTAGKIIAGLTHETECYRRFDIPPLSPIRNTP